MKLLLAQLVILVMVFMINETIQMSGIHPILTDIGIGILYIMRGSVPMLQIMTRHPLQLQFW